MLRHMLLLYGILVLSAGCAHRERWAAVDENDLSARCTGVVTSLSIPARGLVVIRVRPRPNDARLLAEGQTEMSCEIEDEHRASFGPILEKLAEGQVVTAHGYWVRHTRDGVVEHKLRTTTSLRIERR